ncbi:MAG: hypothetical protein KC560_16580, partial [Myxococcales bacterium]|nr:hypothetical protein [Myxococcales bacterium]
MSHPLQARSRCAPPRRLALRLVASALLASLAGCGETPPPVAPSAPLAVPASGYVTSDTCRSCHPGPYASWAASHHSMMTRAATPASVLGDFDGATAHGRGHDIALSREGDRFFARVPSIDWDGTGTPSWEKREIVLVTGSHNLQIYWFETGRSRVLGRLPVAWEIFDRRWFPTADNFIAPPLPDDAPRALGYGEWNHGCIQCHVTDARPHWGGLDHTSTEASEFGIACESCHGPAERHVERMRDPSARYAEHLAPSDDPQHALAIALPPKLPFDRRSQVCGRCHSVWRFASNEHYSRFMTERLPFEPGQDLGEQGFAVIGSHRLDPDSFWPDDEVKPSGREYNGLVASPCFAAGELSCFSCHQMHAPVAAGDDAALAAWRDDQLKPGMRGNEACLQCHDAFRDDGARAAHAHHPAGSSGAECQNCHMPYTNLGLRKAVRSHTITSPRAATDRATGRPNACTA